MITAFSRLACGFSRHDHSFCRFKVGDRVLVSGTKLGTLRYLDITDFAGGLWAGIELDEPVGKNDGCVAGTRLSGGTFYLLLFYYQLDFIHLAAMCLDTMTCKETYTYKCPNKMSVFFLFGVLVYEIYIDAIYMYCIYLI